MQVGKIAVENFRALRQTLVELSSLTALVGENNSGKSAILKALSLFFDNAPKVEENDFYNKNVADPIHITIHFINLTPAEAEKYQNNMLDGELVVTRTLLFGNPKESGLYSVDAMVNPDFAEVRADGLAAKPKRDAYRRLKEDERYRDLPNERAADEIDRFLEEWEENHPGELQRLRVGGFRGWKNVATKMLKEQTDVVYVPAVSKVSDDLHENKSSPVRELLNTISRQSIENKAAFREFKARTSDEIAELTDPAAIPELQSLSKNVSSILKKYYKDSDILATWDPVTDVPISFPQAQMLVQDNNFTADIDHVGHGLQRAVFLSVLEFVARNRKVLDAEEEQPAEFQAAQSDIILAIEEPEIYQHPTKQRLFLEVFNELIKGFSVQTGIRIQILYATHSPLLIDLAQCENIRIVRRVQSGAGPNICASLVRLEGLAVLTGQRKGVPPAQYFSAEQYGASLHIFTADVAEGFFGKCVVLVEGPSDRAILEALFRMKGQNPLAQGIIIKSVEGKTKLDKPLTIFRELGIPTYTLFDNDQSDQENGTVGYNRLLQKIHSVDDADLTDWPDCVCDDFAAWDGNIEAYVKSVCGADVYGQVVSQFAQQYQISSKDCVKSPSIASGIIQNLAGMGHEFEKLDQILEKIQELAQTE